MEMFLAQGDVTVPPWLSPILQGGSFAVLVYLLVYALPQTRREIRREHKEDLDRVETARTTERAEFRQSLQEVTTSFKAESAAERNLCEKQFAVVNTALVGLANGISQEGDTIVATIRQHITEAVSAYRHDLRDIINEAVLTREVYQAKKQRGIEIEQRDKLTSEIEKQ